MVCEYVSASLINGAWVPYICIVCYAHCVSGCMHAQRMSVAVRLSTGLLHLGKFSAAIYHGSFCRAIDSCRDVVSCLFILVKWKRFWLWLISSTICVGSDVVRHDI